MPQLDVMLAALEGRYTSDQVGARDGFMAALRDWLIGAGYLPEHEIEEDTPTRARPSACSCCTGNCGEGAQFGYAPHWRVSQEQIDETPTIVRSPDVEHGCGSTGADRRRILIGWRYHRRRNLVRRRHDRDRRNIVRRRHHGNQRKQLHGERRHGGRRHFSQRRHHRIRRELKWRRNHGNKRHIERGQGRGRVAETSGQPKSVGL